jgi:hypothetical protein
MGLEPGINKSSRLRDKTSMPVNPFDNPIDQIFQTCPSQPWSWHLKTSNNQPLPLRRKRPDNGQDKHNNDQNDDR